MTDYAKWDRIEKSLNSDDDEEDELTKKNKADLAEACKGLIDDELKPFVKKWGLSLDLALCLACKENQKDLVEELLKQGANPNALDPRGRSCLKLSLRYAVSARPIIELLLEHKAEVYSCKDRLSCGGLSSTESTRISISTPTDEIEQQAASTCDDVKKSDSPLTPRTPDTVAPPSDSLHLISPEGGVAGGGDAASPCAGVPSGGQLKNDLRPIVEDELSPLAQASAGEDCDVGVIEHLINHAHWPNQRVKQKTLDYALFHACQKGTGRICRTLMANGADPWGHLEDAAGLTCLHYWASQSDVALISSAVLGLQSICDRNTKLPSENLENPSSRDAYLTVNDVKTLNGETPLHIAVRANSLPAVRMLLAFGFDVAQSSVNGHMAMNLFQTAQMFDLLIRQGGRKYMNHLPRQLSEHPQDEEVIDAGFSPLLAALANNALNDDLAMRMLDEFPEIDVDLEGNQLPLTCAVRKNRSAQLIHKMVVEKNADVNRIEKCTRVPTLILAVTSSTIGMVVGSEDENQDEETGVDVAAPFPRGTAGAQESTSTSTQDHPAAVVPVDAPRDYDRDPTLPWQIRVAKCLLTAGADPLMEDPQGFNTITRCLSPRLLGEILAHLEEMERTETLHVQMPSLVEHLKAASLRKNQELSFGSSTSTQVVEVDDDDDEAPPREEITTSVKSMMKVTEFLVNHKSSCGKSALVIASSSNNVKMIELLLQKGAAVDLAAPVTPLIAAAANCHLEACTLLVETGKADRSLALRNRVALDFVDKNDRNYPALRALLEEPRIVDA
ncbi:unnamed protein product [Amoebophrya sp. A25]|nr:unnamed protein product [Amoebophrya sp. A25]|eukprot:GSA25T00014911001.1